ncbi:MAG: bifunctional UDP-N-acetylglucosamine diphosphorylase/glucosamine-1-phosphate N-acetyltransferase GlmU [Epsilonproteobacteria bacterium]|nr:UDP-N-acetylglucosamine diphosphorylase/glucosamine-1-phosphate N-acetyltransferase [Campylobacterota bacterium]NPA57295.1 bifunctional UDP-N-acetylglucosamine diphosphorylase/glucosamine-1-phosphate N-acetyltransferase GlmU [Campylobacterota bacterium]
MGLSVVILAAGKGTRMKSSLPKVLHTLSGKPMIWHILKEVEKISDDITVVVGHKGELVRREIEGYGIPLRTAVQDLENYPGTGGALRGLSFRHNRVLILNGDMPLVQASGLERFREEPGDIVVGVIEMEDPRGYGRAIIRDGRVVRIVEEKDGSEEERAIKVVNGGVYALSSSLLEELIPLLSKENVQGEYYLTDIVQLANRAGYSVRPLFIDGQEFMGVNSKADLAAADGIMQRRIKRRIMEGGVTLRLPETIYIEVEVQFVGECEVESGCLIKGRSRIEESLIRAHSVIEEARISHSTIGPMARIRPGSEILSSQIGNFVEVKKSRLVGVKAGHLSYLGDSEIGEGTNIGAGTITCNYDGKSKHRTVIGRNVFVGSDSQLVAPLVIEDDVIIAAGTTVTRNLPKGSLGISRTPLKIVGEFYYKFFGKKRDG